jgi:hypothetical protein
MSLPPSSTLRFYLESSFNDELFDDVMVRQRM